MRTQLITALAGTAALALSGCTFTTHNVGTEPTAEPAPDANIETASASAAAPASFEFDAGAQPSDGRSTIIDFDRVDPAQMMALWTELAEPGKPHEYLERFVGNWDMTMRMPIGEGMPPMETKGSSVNTMILGGRYLMTETKYDFMGTLADGVGLTGFDNGRKVFKSLWLSTLETGMQVMTGSLDPSGTTMNFFGQMDEFTTGEIGKPYQMTMRFTDKDTYIVEISEILYGDPFIVVEFEFTRK